MRGCTVQRDTTGVKPEEAGPSAPQGLTLHTTPWEGPGTKKRQGPCSPIHMPTKRLDKCTRPGFDCAPSGSLGLCLHPGLGFFTLSGLNTALTLKEGRGHLFWSQIQVAVAQERRGSGLPQIAYSNV